MILNAGSGTSTFLWGQKRVGKTSLLQVMIQQLRERGPARGVNRALGVSDGPDVESSPPGELLLREP